MMVYVRQKRHELNINFHFSHGAFICASSLFMNIPYEPAQSGFSLRLREGTEEKEFLCSRKESGKCDIL
jgi:hypothetical protein